MCSGWEMNLEENRELNCWREANAMETDVANGRGKRTDVRGISAESTCSADPCECPLAHTNPAAPTDVPKDV
ncbi:hypothetical protein BC832DRAFT_547144 [Gaertneriomyces semiglobifer]|nr:hypothetical protein BC832DRAFT_565536 [Gaertneriomyces semiglobifer]KAI9015029.1 hypothetical protein BC832DRAFT_547144 [Gaertneriomyces semiglobifer]